MISQKTMILIVHRNYRLAGGEEVFLDTVLVPALTLRNHSFEVVRLPALFSRGTLFQSVAELFFMVLGIERWRPSYRFLKKVIQERRPTQIILNNFLPTISLAVPELARSMQIRVAAWVHNGRLSCANGLFFNGKSACHRCFDRGSHWSFFYKCQRSWLQSLLYALTYRRRRVARLARASVDCFVASSEYTSNNVLRVLDALEAIQGLSVKPEVIVARSAAVKVLGPVPVYDKPARLESLTADLQRDFYLFVGRVSYEKGADLFASLAKKFPRAQFVLGGEGPLLQSIRERRLRNLFLLGLVNDDEKNWLYQNANALIVSSRVPENAPMVIVESQPFKVPVVHPRGGGAEELVRVLDRDGCALEDFNGQKFHRVKTSDADDAKLSRLQNQFEDQLDQLIKRKN